MHFKRLFIFAMLLLCACGDLPEEKKEGDVIEQKPNQVKKDNIKVYELQTDTLIDSLLIPIEEFSAFTQAMDNLTKLKPEGITPFLLGVMSKCNALLRRPIPIPFDTPEIQSRLKVVKTELLKVRYYSIEERQKELDESFEALFVAYTAYLKRIEEVSLDFQEEETSNKIIDLNQKSLNQ